MNADIEELKQLIVAQLDVLEFLDIISVEMDQLVDALEDHIEDARQELYRVLR